MGVKPKILGVGGGVGIRGGFKGSLDATDDDSHSASSGSRATHDARHDIDAKASKDFKEASDYFTSRKVSESGSHTDNNADSRGPAVCSPELSETELRPVHDEYDPQP